MQTREHANLKWFGQMTYIHLRSLLQWGSQLPLANLFKGEGQIPLLEPFTSGSLSYKFSKRKKEVNTQAIENKDFAKAFFSIYCFSKNCILCWEFRGIYRPQEDLNLSSKFEFSWVPEVGGASASQYHIDRLLAVPLLVGGVESQILMMKSIVICYLIYMLR